MFERRLGRGISLRKEFLFELADRIVDDDVKNNSNHNEIRSRLDWIEIIPENFLERGGAPHRALLRICEQIPVVFHSTSFSVGGPDEIDWSFLKQVKKFAKIVNAVWITDHISYCNVNGFYFYDLLPLVFNEHSIRHVVERVRQIQDFFEIPFGLENPSYYGVMPGSELNEAEFIAEIIKRTQCGLLLDVNNIYVNCYNHSDQPKEEGIKFLDALPLEQLMEVHIGGHKPIFLKGRTHLLDHHGAGVATSVYCLLQELYRRRKFHTLLLEREQNLPALDDLLDEVNLLWDLRESQSSKESPNVISSVSLDREIKKNENDDQGGPEEAMHFDKFNFQNIPRLIYGNLVPPDPVWTLYREMTRKNICNAIEIIFCKTKAMYSQWKKSQDTSRSWDELCDAYITENWPRDWRLNGSAEKFPEWLPTSEEMKEMADFEWALFLVRCGRESSQEDWINPTLELRYYEYPVLKWYDQPLEEAESLKSPVYLAIFRHPQTLGLKLMELQPVAFDLLLHWMSDDAPEKTAQTFASQLGSSHHFIMDQMRPLIKKLFQEGVLLHE